MLIWINLFLLLILAICTVTDLKSRKIYNKVIFPSLIFAIVANFILFSWSGLFETILGFALGLVILFIPFYLGGMGAGDVKLLAVIGALKGVSFVYLTAIYMAIVGAIIALVILLFKKGWAKTIFYYFYSKKHGLSIPLLLHRKALTDTYPYGVAIATGAVMALVLQEYVIL